MPNSVENFLLDIQSLSATQHEIVCAIRALFHQHHNQLSEEIKYGGLAFNMNSALIGGIYVYKQHISIEFSHGATFNDPDAMLEGGGKHRRHLKIKSLEAIESKQSASFIKQAVADN